ncbi:hypothetical protein CVT25_002793 [Psilocybe cyanescens]|uniref:Extracellular membrane protein CFEM domain-containing protein n=1 Tax=Psilocybe cyanescens TaxID=93625 RepID=A0A409WKX0_PSICY|nr:hypothetical protein CVT25_002793 [Psilocybe cyanescens]
MPGLIIFVLFSALVQAISAQFSCPSACFQGTLDNAGPAVADTFCPPAAGIVNPVYTPNCLCYTPETFDGTPWLFCYTCGSALDGNFADVCGTTQVTQSCPNQKDSISQVCNENGDINNVLGKLCDDGKPSAIVTGITAVVSFLMPELAEGAISLMEEGCVETKAASTISSGVSQVCDIWKTAGCGTVAATTGSSGTNSAAPSSVVRTTTGYILVFAFALLLGLLNF